MTKRSRAPLSHEARRLRATSEPVRAAVEEAIPLVEALVGKLLRGEDVESGPDHINPGKEVRPCRD